MNNRDFGIAVHALAEERPAPTPEFQRACANAYKRGARTNAQLTRALRASLVEIEDAFVELVRRKVVPSTLAIVVAIAALAGCGTKASEQEVTDNTESKLFHCELVQKYNVVCCTHRYEPGTSCVAIPPPRAP